MALSRLETLMAGVGANALARVLFRDDVVYTPLGGTARTIDAQLVVRRDDVEAFDRGERRDVMARLVTRNDATNGINSVLRGSTVAVGGSVFVVESGEAGLDGLMRLELRRSTTVERSNGTWRSGD